MASRLTWSNLSLSAKGLILLAIPLCLQLGLCAVLLQLQQQAEAEARRATEARKVANEINNLISDVVRLFTLARSNGQEDWKTQGYKGYASPRYGAYLKRARDEYAILNQLTIDKPTLNQVVKRSFVPFNEAVGIIEEANRDILAGKLDRVIATSDAKSQRLHDLGGEFISQELLLLAKTEEEFADNSNLKQAEIRETTVKITIGVLIAGILFSLILARFLAHTLIARLRIMAENSERLASNLPLHDPLPGEDEITHLDRTFHSMAKKLEQANADRQEVYNMVTHDLRTPLTAIQGSLEILDLDQSQSPERVKKLVKIAVRNSTRAMNLVNDLLDSQKLEAGMYTCETDDVDLDEVFESVSLDIAEWLEEYGLKIAFTPTDFVVKANQNMLGRVLINLISNAIKYSPRGGLITVAAAVAANNPRMAEITVADQGPGIPKHMIKTVFERFQQVPGTASAKSSGLGLTICQAFVQLQNGNIWATSENGQGTVMHFTLPLA